MKTKIRILMALIGVCLLVAMVCAPAASAAATANISFTVDKSEVNVGDTITVVISNNDLTAEGFGLYLEFDNSLVECTGLTGCYDDSWMGVIIINSRGREADADADYSDTVELTNSDGIYSFAYMPLNDTEILAGTVATLTFTAKAEGVVTFALSEQTSGTDEYSGIADTKTVTIKSATPSCEHPNKVSGGCVDNNDGTHTRLTTCRDCGEVVDETIENCTFTDDGDCTTALECEYCLHTKTAAKDAHVAGDDDGDCTTAVKCVNCEKNAVEAKAAHVAGEDDGDCTTAVKCVNCEKNAVEANATHTGGTATCIAKAKCEVCGTAYGTFADHTFLKNNRGTQLTPGNCITPATYASKCDVCDHEDETKVIDGEVNLNDHIGTVEYTDNGDNTHSAVYTCHNVPYVTNEPHDYTTGGTENTCVCGAVKAPEHICVHDHYDVTKTTHQSICSCGKAIGDAEPHNYKTGTIEHICICGAVEPTGWVEIEGAWYYVYEDYTKATGLSRVPYPTFEIMGNTYAPNAADIAYADSKGRDFIDATEAWFLFEDDGKFAYDSMGYVDHGDSQGKLINGMLPWHIGLVEVAEGEYRYFAGDPVNGGNVIATGKIYVSRNTTDLDVVIGGIYLFDENGALVTGDGITDVDGVLYYLEDNRVAIEAGLIEIDGSYYYVRSGGESAKAGQVVVGRKYYVKNTNGLLAAGMYTFDENGKMVIDPTVNANGIVEIDGVYYYYKAGVKQVGAGVVEMTDELGETFYIYVKSDGTLATGEYWPTTTNGKLERGCYDWGTDGRYYPAN